MKNTVKENREFRYAYKRGKKAVSSHLVVHCAKSRRPVSRIGITVSSFNRAVDRNRAKRLVRAAWQKYYPLVEPGYNVIVVARSRVKGATLEDVDKSMKYCLGKLNLI